MLLFDFAPAKIVGMDIVYRSGSEVGKELSEYKEILNISLSDIMETMKKSITSVPLSEEDTKRLAEIYS